MEKKSCFEASLVIWSVNHSHMNSCTFQTAAIKKKLSASHTSACIIIKQSTMDHVMKNNKNKIYNLKWVVKKNIITSAF